MGKILVTLGGVVIFILFAALIAPYFIDWNRYKPVIEKQSAALIGRQMHIDGDISVRLLPQPVLRMSGVRVAGDHGGVLLAARLIEARLAIEPLLKSNIEITHIEAVEPVLKLVRNRGGALNWRLPAAAGDALAGIGRVSVQNLNIQNGRIIYRDEPRSLKKSINSINADIAAMSLKGPFKISGQLGRERSSFKLATGRVGDTGNLQVSGLLSGSFGEARLKGLMRDIFNDITFAGRLNFRRDKNNGDFLPFSLEAQADIKGAAVQLRDIAGSLGDGSAGMRYKGSLLLEWKDAPRVSGRFSARRADIDSLAGFAGGGVDFAAWPAMLAAGAVPLLPSGLRGEVELRLAGGLLGGKSFSDLEAKIKSDGEQFSLARFKLTLPAQTGFEVSGRFENTSETLGFSGNVSLVTPDLRGFSRWAGYSGVFAPGRGALGLRVKSKIHFNSQGVELADATGVLDGARFSADFRRGFANSGNSLEANIERFDIDRYFASRAAAGLSFTPVRPSLWAKRFSVLLEGKSDFSVRIGTLSHGGAEYKDFSGDLRFNDGDLTIHRFAYQTGQDKKFEISGSITDLNTRPQTHLQIKLQSPAASGAVSGYMLKNLPEVEKGLGIFGRAVLDLRFTGREEGKRVSMKLRGGGAMGGSTALVEADFAGVPERVADGQVKWRLKLVNPSAGALLDQLRFPGRGGGWAQGEGVFEMSGRGAINLLMPFSASLLVPNMQLSLAGTIEKEKNYSFSEARFSLKTEDLRLFENRINGRFSGAEPVPLHVTASLNGPMNDLLVAGASGAAGGAPFSAYGRLVLDGEVPQIELNLKPERFDMPLVTGGLLNARGGGEEGADKKNRPWSSAAFSMERLHGFVLDLNMETARLGLSDMLVLKDATLSARIGEGAFEIQTLAGQLLGGQLLASASFQDDGSGALKGRAGIVLEGARLSRIFKGAGKREVVDGTVSLKTELEARGRSLAGLISSLEGSAAITVAGARLGLPDPFATAMITGKARNAGELERAMKESIGWRVSSYVLDRINGRIANGVLRIEDAGLAVDGRKGSFSLFSDFSARNMDARWTFPLPGLKDAPLLAVVYSGPFDGLRARPDISALLRYVTGRRIEREAEDSRRKAIGGKNSPPAGVIRKKVRALPGLSGAAAR